MTEANESQKETLKRVKKKGKWSLIILDWIFKGKDVGLNKTEKIVDLFVRVFELPPSLPILEIDSNFQNYEDF